MRRLILALCLLYSFELGVIARAETNIQDRWNATEYLVAARKSKKKKKKKKSKKSRSISSSSVTDSGGGGFKKFSARAGIGYVLVSGGTSDAQEAEIGFGYAPHAQFNYYFSPNIHAFGSFVYLAAPYTGTLTDALSTKQEFQFDISFMGFLVGAGYTYKFSNTLGVDAGAGVGFTTFTAEGMIGETDPIKLGGSGYGVGGYANIFYALSPTMRVGLEPNFLFSGAVIEDKSEDAPAAGAEESEDATFGTNFWISVTGEFLF